MAAIVQNQESPANIIRQKRRRALSKNDIEMMAQANYLDNVIIIANGEEKQLNLIEEIRDQILNPEIMNLTDAEDDINQVIDEVTSKSENNMGEDQAKWIYCEKACVKALSSQIKREISSTAFMFRVLTNSVIDTTEQDQEELLDSEVEVQIGGEGNKGKLPLKFKYVNPNNENLSGVWENDHKYFKLEKLDPQSKSSRLIMGLGPSAAGKTFWAKNVIKLMRKTDPEFPRSFLSVDGGLVRELSYIYQDIIRSLAKHPKINGLNNLVSSGWDPFHKSLFKSGHIKKDIKEYLESQKTSDGNLPVSVYVPETLGSPISDGFKKGVDKYVKITGDNTWIGLYIWQGRTPEEDKKWVDAFKIKNTDLQEENIDALSTTVSGEGRELTEGKKYSSSAYNYSKSHGYKAIKQAPGARIDIHNSGGKKTNGVFNKSVVIEYPNGNDEYVLNQDMLNEFNSIYLQKPLNLIGQIGGKKTRRRRKSRRHTRKKRKNKRRKTRKQKGRKKRKVTTRKKKKDKKTKRNGGGLIDLWNVRMKYKNTKNDYKFYKKFFKKK